MDIVKYLGAFHGGIFLYEEDKLTLQAFYGLSASEYEKLSIDAGEGLIGECALNKKPILLDEVPEQYETIISSGLGQAPPNSIMLYPLYANNITVGVIEVASFHKFTEHDKLLMEKVAESIAVTLSSKLNR